MSTKFWINRIHSSDNRADLSHPIKEPNDIAISNSQTNSQVEVDLRGNPSDTKTKIAQGDIVYIAVSGFYQFADGEKRNSLRIVAKGVADQVYYRTETGGDIPVVVFVQGSFEHMTAPMLNGLDVRLLNKEYRNYESPIQSPYWSISADEASYIDKNIFSGTKNI